MDEHHEHRVRERAYSLWEQEGRPDGRHEDHWRQASQEVEPGEQQADGGDDRTTTEDQPATDRQGQAGGSAAGRRRQQG